MSTCHECSVSSERRRDVSTTPRNVADAGVTRRVSQECPDGEFDPRRVTNDRPGMAPPDAVGSRRAPRSSMLIYRWNGERWCRDDMAIWRRVARWFVWLGGWDAHGRDAFKHGFSPVSVLGHVVTYFGHWAQAKTPWGYLVVNWRERYAFIARDGTPDGAHVWLYGAPTDVVRACDSADAEHERWRARKAAR